MINPNPLAGSEARGPLVADERPRVVHSHHYNTALVRSLLEMERIDARGILRSAAAELAMEALRERPGGEDPLAAAGELFRESGLGRLDLSGIRSGGGTAVVEHSHFAEGWSQKFGRSKEPVCALPEGFLAGALAAAYGRRFEVAEIACVARGDRECRFLATDAGDPPAAPDLRTFPAAPLALPAPSAPAFDEQAVVAALLDTPLCADREGRILALGGSLTHLWADFYSRVSAQFEREVPAIMGAKFSNLPSLVLTEAGHSYAFHTFGGILRSEQWHQRVVPLLTSREDWLHAMVAVINLLGWGSWRVHTLVPHERVTVRVYEGYEATGYRRQFGPATGPRCYLARGTVAALMNLLYVGDIESRPELTPSYYNLLFRSPLSFRAVETRCNAADDPYCEFIANPLSLNLSERLKDIFG